MKCGKNVVLCALHDFFLQFIFDFQPEDVFGSLADLGWMAGHSSVVYGPLCNGATTVLFESVATYPNCGMGKPYMQAIFIHLTPHASAQSSILALAFRTILGDD